MQLFTQCCENTASHVRWGAGVGLPQRPMCWGYKYSRKPLNPPLQVVPDSLIHFH